VANVSAQRSTWARWNLRAEAERLLRTECRLTTLGQHRQAAEAIVTMAISPALSICADAPALLDEPPALRRADGESVFVQHAAARYTSQAVLDAEQRLLVATRTPAITGTSILSAQAALDGYEARSGTTLDSGQRHLVTTFASDGRRLLAGIGPASAGKTTAMRALAHILGQHRRRLIPLATSAAVLARELVVPAGNLHKFLHEWHHGPDSARLRAGAPVPYAARLYSLAPGDVVLVDEAGMAGTFRLDQLTAIAASRGAVVRLLGDDRQLSAVESGGALRLIAAQPGTSQLTRLYRFRDPAEAAATLQLRAGDTTAIDWYSSNGRIRSGSRDRMPQAAYHGWKTDMLAGKTTLMAAGAGTDVVVLSAQARTERVLAGHVEKEGVTLRDGNLAVHRPAPRRLTNVRPPRTRRPRPVPRGLRPRARRAALRHHRPPRRRHHRRHRPPPHHPRHDPRAPLRHHPRHPPLDPDEHTDRVKHDPRSYAAREILHNILATEGSELSATDTIRTSQEQAESLATLIPRYLHTAHQLAETRYRDTAIQVFGEHRGQALIADPAWGALVRRLYDAETAGWPPVALLTAVDRQRELDSAESVAEVLCWRIDGYLIGHPAPADNAPRDSGTPAASDTDIIIAALGPRLAQRTQAEPAWPALQAAVRRAHAAGHDPAALLGAAACARELRSARSITEVLAWHIGRHLAASPSTPPPAPQPRLLPWITARQPSAHQTGQASDADLTRYLDDATKLITARVQHLADDAQHHRPARMNLLGQPPPDGTLHEHWLTHIAIIAAYRDQYQITGDDARQILGPYPGPGRAGHTPYWHAAESIAAARGLAGLATAHRPDPVRTQIATDVYLALPDDERAAICTAMATRLDPLWFGHPADTDDHSATSPAHAETLLAILTERRHLTQFLARSHPTRATDPSLPQPLEAALVQQRAARHATSPQGHVRRAPTDTPLLHSHYVAAQSHPRDSRPGPHDAHQPRI